MLYWKAPWLYRAYPTKEFMESARPCGIYVKSQGTGKTIEAADKLFLSETHGSVKRALLVRDWHPATRIGSRRVSIRARSEPGIKGAWNMESYTVDTGA